MRINGTDDDRRDENKRERALSSPAFPKATNGGRSRVLTMEVVSNSSDNHEEDHLEDSKACDGFWEILRSAHFGDETRVEGLTKPEECNAVVRYYFLRRTREEEQLTSRRRSCRR